MVGGTRKYAPAFTSQLRPCLSGRRGTPMWVPAGEHKQDIIAQDGRTFRLKLTYSF
jgi:hypothetical protein